MKYLDQQSAIVGWYPEGQAVELPFSLQVALTSGLGAQWEFVNWLAEYSSPKRKLLMCTWGCLGELTVCRTSIVSDSKRRDYYVSYGRFSKAECRIMRLPFYFLYFLVHSAYCVSNSSTTKIKVLIIFLATYEKLPQYSYPRLPSVLPQIMQCILVKPGGFHKRFPIIHPELRTGAARKIVQILPGWHYRIPHNPTHRKICLSADFIKIPVCFPISS